MAPDQDFEKSSQPQSRTGPSGPGDMCQSEYLKRNEP